MKSAQFLSKCIVSSQSECCLKYAAFVLYRFIAADMQSSGARNYR